MKNIRSFLHLKAFHKNSSLLSLLCYLCTYFAVLGLSWAENSALFSWYWKLAILFFCTLLFLISIVRSNSFDKSLKFLKEKEKEIARLREQNGIQNLELAESMQVNLARSRFLAHISHEIRNPLNSILGFSELLSKRKLDPQSRQFVDMIAQSGDGLRLLLNDILDLNKIGDGKLKLESISFNFKELVSTTILPYTYMAKQKKIEFELIFDPNIPLYLLADPHRFRQVLLNLISNSLKFTQQGKISVQLIRQWENDDNVGIRTLVSDTGIGIQENQLTNIFKPFIQSEASTARKYGGSGLGLSIVAELVTLMDGEISVQSPNPLLKSTEEAPGTHFILDLNFRVDTRKKHTHQKNEQSELELDYKLPASIRILVAEDNKVSQVLFQHMLEGMGAQVDLVNNGQEAIDVLKSTPYDLIFMDIQMPIMNGLQASRCIRKELGISTPIIGATANAFEEDIREALQAGMNDNISKPFRQKDMYDKVCRWGIKKTDESLIDESLIKASKKPINLSKLKPSYQEPMTDKNIDLP